MLCSQTKSSKWNGYSPHMWTANEKQMCVKNQQHAVIKIQNTSFTDVSAKFQQTLGFKNR